MSPMPPQDRVDAFVMTSGREDFEAVLLDPGTARRPRKVSPAALLNARYRYVSFYEAGRSELLEELGRWCTGEGAVSARLFYGEGGMGKTRLFIEWAERLREQGWNAGFLSRGEMERARFEDLMASAQKRPVMVVIDYAESQHQLVKLLRVVAKWRDGESAGRVRLALLARAPGDWWEELRRVDTSVGALLWEREPTEVPPLAPQGPQRDEVFREAARSFAQILGRTVPATVPSYLGQDRFDRVLYVHMAALAEVEGLACGSEGLMDEVLWHEERFWGEWLETEKGAVADGEMRQWREECRQLVSALTLVGGADTLGRLRLLQERACPRVDELQPVLVHDLYPAEDEAGQMRYVGWLEPDLLGEGMVRRALLREGAGSGGWLKKVFAGLEDAAVRMGLEVLGRISVESEEARSWIAALLQGEVDGRAVPALEAAKAVGRRTAYAAVGEELFRALEREGSREVAAKLEEAGLPEDTVSLREVARWVVEMLVRHLRADHGQEQRAERARLLNNLSTRWADVGMREEAVVAAEDAVWNYRELVASHSEDSLSALAASMSNLGIRYAEVGRREEALTATREAVGYYRQLVAKHPETALPDLARSLNNLSNHQSELGQAREALTSMQEAISLRRQLAKARPELFLPHLAMSLNNLSAIQGALARREEALVSMQGAVGYYRQLAEKAPETFLPDLALGLNNLGGSQSMLGRREEALASVQEAAAHFRRLAARHPEAFHPALAMALNNLGTMQGDLGRAAEAVASMQEAVMHYRYLAEQQPALFLPDLALSLNGQGRWLSNVGRGEEALASMQEAVAIQETLAAQQPAAFLQPLARSLNNLGLVLSELGRKEEALATAWQAVARYRQLVAMDAESFLPDLAMGLNNLGNRQNDLERREEALSSLQEVVSIRRQLAAQQPAAFLPALAMGLNNLAKKQAAAGRGNESLRSVEEALEILWPLFLSQPPAFERSTGTVLQHLFVRLAETGQPPSTELLERRRTFDSMISVH